MPTKKIKLSFYLMVTVCLTLGMSISFQSLLAAWTGPSAAPTGGNKEAPVYTNSDVNQVIKKTTASYAPAEMLEIFDYDNADTARLRITDLGENPEIQLQDSASHWAIYNNNTGGNELRFWYGNDRITISTAGNVGIGTDPGAYMLNVAGNINTSNSLCLSGDCHNAWNQAGIGPILTVDDSDGSLNVSPNIGDVRLSLNTAKSNNWSGEQSFAANTNFPGPGIWNTAGNVGIGMNNPGTYRLYVNGNIGTNGNTNFPGPGIWNTAGNVGIGTGNPGTYRLYVNGDFRTDGDICIAGDCKSGWNQSGIGPILTVSNSDGTLTISPTTGSVVASLNTAHPNTWTGAQTFNANSNFPGSGVWNTSGNVGIGTINPGAYRLNVAGDINTSNSLCLSGNCHNAWNQSGIGPILTVSNSDSSLTISPTIGSVVASLNTAHPNTWTGSQTFASNSNFPGSGVWNTSGNVGIGTNNPGTYKLYVTGNIRTDSSLCLGGNCIANWNDPIVGDDNQTLGVSGNSVTLTNSPSITVPYALRARALDADALNCDPNEYAMGVDTFGAAQGCTVDSDTQDITLAGTTVTLTNGGSFSLGTMAIQNSNSVNITGGTVSGLLSLGVNGNANVTGTVNGGNGLCMSGVCKTSWNQTGIGNENQVLGTNGNLITLTGSTPSSVTAPYATIAGTARALGLTANPGNCGAGFALGIDTDGSAECRAITWADITNRPAGLDDGDDDTQDLGTSGDTVTLTNSPAITVPYASRAGTLNANGGNCAAGQFPLGVNAVGAVESCTADSDTQDLGTSGNSITLTNSLPITAPYATNANYAATANFANSASYATNADTANYANSAGYAGYLAANPWNCGAGNYISGINQWGQPENCTPVPASPGVGAAVYSCPVVPSADGCPSFCSGQLSVYSYCVYYHDAGGCWSGSQPCTLVGHIVN